MGIKRLACASCGASNFKHDEAGSLICRSCGAMFASPREDIACKICGTLNPPQAKICMECGGTLGKQCQACYHVNPPGADHCEQCAQPLDTLSTIMSRQREAQFGQVEDRSKRAAATKYADMAYMEEQRQRLEAEEMVRRKRLEEQRIRHQQEQQKIMRVLTIALIIIAVVIGGILLFNWLGTR